VNSKLVWQISLMLVNGVIFLLYLIGTELAGIRIGYSLILIFFLPGYMILTAVFTTDMLGVPERIAYAITLSIAVIALSGLLLNLTHWGLEPIAWVSTISALSLFFGVIGFVRLLRAEVDMDMDNSPVFIKFHEGLFMLIAGVIVVLALVFARIGAEQAPLESYTEFWMLPRVVDDAQAFDVGIRNQEQEPVHYRLQVRTRNNVVEEWDVLSLADGETWETRVVIPARFMDSQFFRANLYRLDDPTVIYRQLTINYE
jgi:uncharacterized membrane protein